MIRREFIKHAGVFAGGLLLNSYISDGFARSAAPAKLNIGVIGCGDRGVGLIHVMRQLPEQYQLRSVCDVLDFRLKDAQKAAASANLQLHKDYRKLLDDKELHAVIIALPLNMHYPAAAAALKAGKHVYLEKTMTYNIDQTFDLVKLVAKHPELTLQVGHQYRYTPLYFQVKEMIEEGYLGKVTTIDCRWDRNWNWRRAVPDPSLERQINWRMYREYSGGLPAELLSHQIDFINWAFNTHPDQILGSGGIDFYKDGRETYDNVQAVFRYSKDGMIGNFGATCASAHDGYRFRLKGSKGTVSLSMNQGRYYPEKEMMAELETVDGVTGATKLAVEKDGGLPIMKGVAMKDGSWYALVDFHKCILEKEQPTSNIITGATTSFCVHLANEAIYNNTIEKWKPEYNLS